MEGCSVCRRLAIVEGGMEDYRGLACYHYRAGRCGAVAAVFALRPIRQIAGLGTMGTKAVGVIVYTMPAPGLELRNAATGNFFTGFDRRTQLALINKNIRCIGRVIIEPRFRGLGLASRLVRETMPMVGVPIVEALAVMGLVNPFFEKAGMKAYTAKSPTRCTELIEAFSVVGIEQGELIDAELVQRKLDLLKWPAVDFIEGRLRRFLQSYGKRRDMPAGLERTRFALSRLTERPVYYIWFNHDLVSRCQMLDPRRSEQRESRVEYRES